MVTVKEVKEFLNQFEDDAIVEAYDYVIQVGNNEQIENVESLSTNTYLSHEEYKQCMMESFGIKIK